MYKINKKNVAFRKINNTYYIVQTKSLKLFTLNKTATLLWDLLLKGYDLNRMIKKITEKYDVSEDAARNDAMGIFEKLCSEGVLEYVNE